MDEPDLAELMVGNACCQKSQQSRKEENANLREFVTPQRWQLNLQDKDYFDIFTMILGTGSFA